jgi:hypothetical protein
MRFEFKLLDHDSADAELDDGVSHITVYASCFEDPLGHLLYALWRLMQGEAETRCSWVEEPGEYRWIMRRDGADVRFEYWNSPNSFRLDPTNAAD